MDRPDVIVLGVGHSGTSILTRCLIALGWAANDIDPVYCESLAVKFVNRKIVDGEDPARLQDQMLAAMTSLSHPFVIKDPRFPITLGHWLPSFARAGLRPALLFIQRDRSAVEASYLERRELVDGGLPGAHQHSVGELLALALEQYRDWPFAKLEIAYEQMIAAASLIRSERKPRREGGLWIYDDPVPG